MITKMTIDGKRDGELRGEKEQGKETTLELGRNA